MKIDWDDWDEEEFCLISKNLDKYRDNIVLYRNRLYIGLNKHYNGRSKDEYLWCIDNRILYKSNFHNSKVVCEIKKKYVSDILIDTNIDTHTLNKYVDTEILDRTISY